jgi:hypothetical protein
MKRLPISKRSRLIAIFFINKIMKELMKNMIDLLSMQKEEEIFISRKHVTKIIQVNKTI